MLLNIKYLLFVWIYAFFVFVVRLYCYPLKFDVNYVIM
jgi:hypothetical protein